MVKKASEEVAKRHEITRKVVALQPTKEIPFFSDDITAIMQQNEIRLDAETLSAINQSLCKKPREREETFYREYPLTKVINVVDGKEIKTVVPASPATGEICVIDWLSFTVTDVTFDDNKSSEQTSEGVRQAMLIKNLSKVLTSILGFGVAEQLPNGIHFYDRSYKLEHNCGIVCIGGQRNTVLVMINGIGCTYAKYGWQADLHAFFALEAVNPKITRIDLAHDDLEGEYSNLAYFTRQFDKGGFNMIAGGRKPNIEMRGNWKNPNGKGRTLYIGSSKSPKYCRIYEKGKELGDADSKWVRTEVEFKAKGQLIPLDVLIKPSNFFLKSYPCFYIFNKQNVTGAKFERIQKQELISMTKAISITKHQFGRFLYAFRKEFSKHGLNDKDLLDILTDIENKKYPDKLDILTIPDFFKPTQKR